MLIIKIPGGQRTTASWGRKCKSMKNIVSPVTVRKHTLSKKWEIIRHIYFRVRRKTAVCEFPKMRITNDLYWLYIFYNFLTTLKMNCHTTPHSRKYSYSMGSADKPMCSQFREARMLSTETRGEQVFLLLCILFVRLFQIGVYLLMIPEFRL